MSTLREVLAELDAKAGDSHRSSVTLPRGLGIVIDRRRDPHVIRFGRPGPAWPSGEEISTCRRAGLEIPNTATTSRFTVARYNIIEYAFPAVRRFDLEQPALPELAPLVQVEHLPDESLDSQFDRWLQANPHVLQAFLHYAVEAWHSGARHIGGKLIVERIRFETMIRSNGEDSYKINNNWTSRLVRAAIAHQPELAGMFETRELRS